MLCIGCRPAQRYQSGCRRSRNLESRPLPVMLLALGTRKGQGGLLGLMPVSLAPVRICCKFWNCPGFARRLVAPKLWGYAGAGGLDWITAPSRALRRAWLPLPRPAPNRPALPRPAPLLGIPAGAGLLALLCPSGWAGAGAAGLALLALAVRVLGCWPAGRAALLALGVP